MVDNAFIISCGGFLFGKLILAAGILEESPKDGCFKNCPPIKPLFGTGSSGSKLLTLNCFSNTELDENCSAVFFCGKLVDADLEFKTDFPIPPDDAKQTGGFVSGNAGFSSLLVDDCSNDQTGLS